ncbi:MAG: peptidoglycan DD-metalloendopeptidase family protein [Acutalibacter sp.]|nr:peptidoglycan DD-metalloendopeptidase family protein [Acutalibacter sp.]
MKLKYHPSFAKRLVSFLMALCLLQLTPVSVLARTTEEVEAEQRELEQERDQLEAKLAELRQDEAQKQEYQETLQQQITVVQEQITNARRDIDELNANITLLNEKLKKAEEESADTLNQFKKRVSAIYQAGSVSTLEILLNSSSFSDFSMRSEMLSNMSRHDQELMDKIDAYMKATEADRTEREKQKALVAEQKKNLEQNQKELDALYAENAEAIAALQGAQSATSEALQTTQAEIEARDQEIKEIIEEQKRREEEERKRQEEAAANNGASSNPTSPGGQGDVIFNGGGSDGFRPCWPMPGVTYISDEYGGYRGHQGMDIAGAFGTPIVAAESGRVERAWTADTWGMGWGYHVFIYHNGTYSTLYAHMSSVAVSQGQYVEQGTIIGYEGSTGDSTGPHLHFEVWQNGSRVNPRNFLF